MARANQGHHGYPPLAGDLWCPMSKTGKNNDEISDYGHATDNAYVRTSARFPSNLLT